MNDNSLPDYDENGDDPLSNRAAARRAKRESRRVTGRPASMRRKTPGMAAGGEDSGQSGALPSRESRTPLDERPAQKSRTRKPAGDRLSGERRPERAPVRKRREPMREPEPKRPRQTKARPRIEEEGFELRSQPDGTLHRVKITNKKPGEKTIRARRQVREDPYGPGPGPAIFPSAAPEVGAWRRIERDLRRGAVDDRVGQSAAFLSKTLGAAPRVAVILGTGLSQAASFSGGKSASFSEIPGFPEARTPGHPGIVRSVHVEGEPVIFCEGRVHYYESGSMADAAHAALTFARMGVERLIITTAAGALNSDYALGDVMFVEDHINMMGDNPLFGMNPGSGPAVFLDVTNLYERDVIDDSDRISRRARMRHHVGTLAAMRGPVYETRAERRLLTNMGADAVCMSVVPEAIAGAYAGARVTALALIVNSALDDGGMALTHDAVESEAARHSLALKRLISAVIAR
ncbi:MAG: purine-nucleoside phosphorylase [Nitrospinae bacterium]|nr:purine-nucleoside phosphorylase [Nitrospinota bacterium]